MLNRKVRAKNPQLLIAEDRCVLFKMRYLLTILILLFIQINLWSQTVSLNNVHIKSDSITKIVYVKIVVNDIKLDSIKRIKIIDKAYANTKNLNIYLSDTFYSDGYLDNYNNEYVFVFDSIPNQITAFEKINGVLRYFNPSIEKKSIVNNNKGREIFDSNILQGYSSDIKVVPIDGLTLHKLKKQRRKLNKYLNKVISINHLDKNLFFETLNKHFNQYKEFELFDKLSNMIIFYIEQPYFKVVSINIEDSSSENRNGYYSVDINYKLNGPKSAIWISKNSGEKLDHDFNVEIMYENKKSIRDFEFELLDVNIEKNSTQHRR